MKEMVRVTAKFSSMPIVPIPCGEIPNHQSSFVRIGASKNIGNTLFDVHITM